MDKEIKTHKRKNKTPVDPGDLVSEKSLQRNYKIIGKVINACCSFYEYKYVFDWVLICQKANFHHVL